MKRTFPKARWLQRIQQLRAKVYDHDTLSDADRVALVQVLDAVLTAKDAEGIGRGVLDAFNVQRGKGRQADESTALAAEYALNAYRFGVSLDEIASTTGWAPDAVLRFLALHGIDTEPRQPK